MLKFRRSSSLFERAIVEPVMGGAMGLAKGLWEGVTAKPWRDRLSKDGTQVIKGLAGEANVSLGYGTNVLAYGVGRAARGAGQAAGVAAAPIVQGAAKTAAYLTVNTPQDALEWGTAAAELGKKIWNATTQVGRETVTHEVQEEGGRIFQQIEKQKYRELKPWVREGAMPAALVIGGGLGALQGEIDSRAGYVDTSPMTNMIGETRTPGNRPVQDPGYGSAGQLVLALHNLRRGR